MKSRRRRVNPPRGRGRGTAAWIVRGSYDEPPQILCFADAVYFVAASLYEIDEANERGDDDERARGALRRFLEGRGLLTNRIKTALARGDAYWRLERELAEAWRAPRRDAAAEDALLEAALRASAAKSFDYEVLSLVVIGLTGDRGDRLRLLPFFNACFQLVEIEDDLRDYATDAARPGAFNVYKAFARRHGAAAPDALRAWIRTREAAYVDARGILTDEQLEYHFRRNEQQEGSGPVMAPRSGRWDVPEPIL